MGHGNSLRLKCLFLRCLLVAALKGYCPFIIDWGSFVPREKNIVMRGKEPTCTRSVAYHRPANMVGDLCLESAMAEISKFLLVVRIMTGREIRIFSWPVHPPKLPHLAQQKEHALRIPRVIEHNGKIFARHQIVGKWFNTQFSNHLIRSNRNNSQ